VAQTQNNPKKPVKIAAAAVCTFTFQFSDFLVLKHFGGARCAVSHGPAGGGSPLAFGSSNWLPLELFQPKKKRH
jgi:hypothetical protein